MKFRPGQNTERARRLRQQHNLSEQRAWQALRGLREKGWPVRRQHPVGVLIVDFAVVKAKLAIEIDGSVHDEDEVRATDERRDARLVALGWRVLRIPADLTRSPGALLSHVLAALGDEPVSDTPSPCARSASAVPLPQAGEG